MTLLEFDLPMFEQRVVQERNLAVVSFWADWCGPCHLQRKVFDRLTAEMKATKKILIGLVNVDEQQALAERFAVKTLPSTLIFAEGNLVEALVGFQAEEYLKGYLEYLEKETAKQPQA